MPSAAPIRFRCFRCHKLLGVSRSKAGAIVACPQCAAELIVPEPEDSPESPSAEPSPRPSGSRVEEQVVPWDALPGAEGRPESAPPGGEEPAFPPIQMEPFSLRPDPPALTRTSSRSRADAPAYRPEPPPAPEPEPITIPPPMPAPVAPARSEAPVIPPVVTEIPSLRDEPAPRSAPSTGPLRERGPRRDDVILPRAAVLLWSFLVLVALVMSFVAGLLAGRFLWARGVKIEAATLRAERPARREAFAWRFPFGREQPDCFRSGREV